ncbi:MAG: alpha/beta fold hydrolase [Nocardioidaceae bacterium]
MVVTPVQDIRFCTSADGTRIAYAVHGSGPPLVLDACWLSHLQYDWQSPVWRHYLTEFGRFATVIRFDERGHGLSDRDVDDFSAAARLADLEAVVDDAGLDRFALMAMAQGGPISIEYVARHPDRVSRLMLYGSYAGAQARATEEERDLDAAFEALIRVGWERPTPEFRRVFTYQMIPGATEEQMRWLDELQKRAVTADTAVVSRQQRNLADATRLLASLDLPTLVLHAREDHMNPFHEARYLAAHIPGARLVPLESGNHILLEDEPAWPVFLQEVEQFVADDRVAGGPAESGGDLSALSSREREVLALAARGHDNEGIATELTLSVRTVERHLQNVYLKLGLQGRNARTAAVARLLSQG